MADLSDETAFKDKVLQATVDGWCKIQVVYFRKRIGKDGVKKIFQVSINLHGKKAMEKEILIDTAVQEKILLFPTDTKLYRKIVGTVSFSKS